MRFRMAFALWLAFSFTGNARGQDLCPNFSGQFLIDSADRQTTITISQTRCDRIHISRQDNSRGRITIEEHDLKLDGTFQQDTPWRGNSEAIQVSAKFTSAALEFVARPIGSTNPAQFSWKALYVLRSNGDVEIRDYNRTTGFYEPVAVAVREQ